MTTSGRNWLQHALERTNWRPQNQAVALATLGLFLALIIGALYLSQVAANAITGRSLETLIVERDNLRRTNERLRAEIGELTSVPRLLARAETLGFRRADQSNIEYLVIDGYNPNRSETVAPLNEEGDTVPVYDESFGGWLQQQWDSLRRQFEGFGNSEE